MLLQCFGFQSQRSKSYHACTQQAPPEKPNPPHPHAARPAPPAADDTRLTSQSQSVYQLGPAASQHACHVVQTLAQGHANAKADSGNPYPGHTETKVEYGKPYPGLQWHASAAASMTSVLSSSAMSSTRPSSEIDSQPMQRLRVSQPCGSRLSVDSTSEPLERPRIRFQLPTQGTDPGVSAAYASEPLRRPPPKSKSSIESRTSEKRVRLQATLVGPIVAGADRYRRGPASPRHTGPLSPHARESECNGDTLLARELQSMAGRTNSECLQQQMYSGALLYGDSPSDVARRLLSRHRSGRSGALGSDPSSDLLLTQESDAGHQHCAQGTDSGRDRIVL